MRALISCAVLVSLCLAATPALSASGKAKQAARRACIARFGGTTELVRVDKENGYVYCRDPKGRQTERLPFRWDKGGKNDKKDATAAKPDKPRTTPTKQETRQAPVQEPAPVQVAPPVQEPEPLPTTVPQQDPAPQKAPEPAPAPVQPSAQPPAAPSSSGAVSTQPAPAAPQRTYDSDLLDQARSICIKQYGPQATVDYIDDKTWEVVCKKP